MLANPIDSKTGPTEPGSTNRKLRKEKQMQVSEVGFEPTPSHEDQNLSLAP